MNPYDLVGFQSVRVVPAHAQGKAGVTFLVAGSDTRETGFKIQRLLSHDGASEALIKELVEALKPFADFGRTGFEGSLYEKEPDETQVLYSYETKGAITLGNFREADALLRRAEAR